MANFFKQEYLPLVLQLNIHTLHIHTIPKSQYQQIFSSADLWTQEKQNYITLHLLYTTPKKIVLYLETS